jgi:hypothetical protein
VSNHTRAVAFHFSRRESFDMSAVTSSLSADGRSLCRCLPRFARRVERLAMSHVGEDACIFGRVVFAFPAREAPSLVPSRVRARGTSRLVTREGPAMLFRGSARW